MRKLLIMLLALAAIAVCTSDASAGIFGHRRHRVRAYVVDAPVVYHRHARPRHYVVPVAPVYHHGYYRGNYGGGGIYIRAPFVRIGIGF